MPQHGPYIHVHSLEASQLGDGLESGLSPAVLLSLSVRAIFLAAPDDLVVVDREPDPNWLKYLERVGLELPQLRVVQGGGETLVERIIDDAELCAELRDNCCPIKPYMGSIQIQMLAHQLGLRYIAPDNQLVDRLNHKSNLDHILQEIGLPRIPTEVSTRDHIEYDVRSAFEEHGALMIRSDLSIGGHGVWRIENAQDIDELVNGIKVTNPDRKFIWQPLKAVTNSPNVQYEISDDSCTLLGISAQRMTESFAFGGNDYPSPLSENQSILDQSQRTAQWLQSQGYRGLVGLDFIVTSNQEVFIVEINPRVNTSTFPLILSHQLGVHAFKLMTGLPTQSVGFAELESLVGSDLLYDQHRKEGIIPLMIPTKDRPVCDVMVFANTREAIEVIADHLHDRLEAIHSARSAP